MRTHPTGRRHSARPFVIALCAAAFTAFSPAVGATGAPASTPRPSADVTGAGPVVLTSSVPPRLPAGAVALGALGPNTVLSLDAALEFPGRAALSRYVAQVGNPRAANFHQYLSASQVGARFGPSPSVLANVARQFNAAGFVVGAPPSDRASLPLRGTAAQVERALGVRIERFRLPAGRVAFANENAPVVPRSLARDVTGISGLDDLVLSSAPSRAVTTTPVPRRAGLVQAASATAPCASATSIASANGPYTPDQLAAAYGINPLYADGDYGQGITIGIIEAEPYSAADLTAFETCMGITAPSITNVPLDGFSATGPGSSAEAALDIETAIAIAPRATFTIYEVPTATPSQLADAYDAAVGHNDIISTSWGQCEPDVSSLVLGREATDFAAAAAAGEAVFAAAGDNGAYDCASNSPHAASLAVDDPADQQNVVAVGGTTLSAAGSSAQAEVAWDNTNGATGGGVATNPTRSVGLMPAYQQSALSAVGGPLTSCGSGQDCRDVPDVSAMAEPGFVVDYCQSADTSCPAAQRVGWQGVGGTSGAAPMWAGLAALIAASPYCSYDGTAAGTLLGSFPADLYGTLSGVALGGQTLYSSAFTDIVTGNNGYINYSAGPGYDLVSGLGSPIAAYANSASPGLASALCAESGSPPSPTITAITPASGPDDAVVNVTLTGTNLLAVPGGEQLKLGSAFATNVSCSSSTSCTATIPELDAANAAITPVLSVAGLRQSASAPTYASIPAAPAFSAQASPAQVAFGASATLSVSGLPSDASGTLTFSSGSTALCSFTLGAATSCSTPVALPVGSYAVSAAYSGDTNFLASSAITNLVVTQTNTAVSAVASPASTSYGRSVLLSVSGLAPGATGTVTFTSGTATLCTYTLPSESACSTSSSLQAGSYSVNAAYGGDNNDAAATTTTTFVVGKASPGSVLVADALPTAATTGSSVSLLLAGLPSAATGTVSFSAGSRQLCSYSRPAATSCRTASTLPIGSYAVSATYSGDANFTSSSATTHFSVAAAALKVKGKKCAVHRETVTLKKIVEKHGHLVTERQTKSVRVTVCTRVK